MTYLAFTVRDQTVTGKPAPAEVAVGLDKYPASSCSARVEVEQGSERMTLTRIAAGGLLLGPAGAILGGMAKKRGPVTGTLVVGTPKKAHRVSLKGDREIEKALQLADEITRLAGMPRAT